MTGKKRLKMAIIAGASYALKYKEQHPKANDQEALNEVTKEADNILENIDEI